MTDTTDIMDDEPLLKITEAAKILGITSEHLRRELIAPHAGPIPAVKVGSHWRIKKQDLIDYIEKRYYISGTRPTGA